MRPCRRDSSCNFSDLENIVFHGLEVRDTEYLQRTVKVTDPKVDHATRFQAIHPEEDPCFLYKFPTRDCASCFKIVSLDWF